MRRLAFVAFTLGLAAVASAQGTWKVVDRDRGIVVDTRAEPGRDLPTMRGRGVIEGEVNHVLAVVLDERGATEWAEGADRCKLLRRIDARTSLIYTYTDTPWPVSDRDIVMRRTIEVIKPGAEYRVRLLCAPRELAQVEGVIRVLDCDSHFYLRKESASSTFMEYQVNLDPGGSLPDWLIRWAAKKIPMNTFVSLEQQVEKVGSRYDREAARWEAQK
jgi:hypothetical protein